MHDRGNETKNFVNYHKRNIKFYFSNISNICIIAHCFFHSYFFRTKWQTILGSLEKSMMFMSDDNAYVTLQYLDKNIFPRYLGHFMFRQSVSVF